MKTIKICESKNYDGEIVRINGFVKQVRDLKSMQFLLVQDITQTIQVTIFKNETNEKMNKLVSGITVQSSVSIIGKIHVDDFVKLNGVELLAETVILENRSNNNMPIDLTDYAETNRDLRLDWRFLDLRTEEHQLIFKVQTTAEMAMREFWIEHGFIEIHSPKLMNNPSESGAELFSLDYFGRKAYLAQSPQFYKQMGIASGFERVFEIGPVFRANPSATSRHDTEFTSVDVEMAWIDSYEDVMKFEEEWINYFMGKIKEKHGEEIKRIFNREVVVPSLPFPRINMEEAKKIVKSYDYEVPPETKGDLDPQAERILGAHFKEKFGHEFVFVTEFPWSVRPFYHMRDKNDPSKTMSYDLLWNGLEVTTGAQREHRYEVLCKQAEEKGLSCEKLKDYLSYFDYGCPPHGGYGFGLTRMLMNILGYKNVREVTYIYRGPERLNP